MSRQRILVIEDDTNIQELVKYNLEKEGFRVLCALTGEEGLEMVESGKPNLVVLDLMLPGIDGLDVCRKLKTNPETQSISVIMLTAKGEESDIVVGLELGADDYITKPFSPKVLIARIKAVARRKAESDDLKSTDSSKVIEINDLLIHPGRREVRINDEIIDLTANEFELLRFLAGRPGWVFTRQQILDAVRGDDIIVTARAVDVQIVGLRKKLGDAGELIETVRGVGYRFRE